MTPDTQITMDATGSHCERINWSATGVDRSVHGTKVDSPPITIGARMRPARMRPARMPYVVVGSACGE